MFRIRSRIAAIGPLRAAAPLAIIPAACVLSLLFRAASAVEAPRAYRLEYVLYNRDIGGSTASRVRVEGTYTRGLPGGLVRWNDVLGASAPGEDAPFSAGSPLPSMNGLSYRVEEIAGDSLFAGFPAGDLGHLMKTLVWDGAMFDLVEAIHGRLESIGEGMPARVSSFEDFDVDMAGFAALRMKDLVVERVGVSTTNGKGCAVFRYRSLSNPVAGPGVSGRSLYFGGIWISRENGGIERLTLDEDVVMQLGAGGPEARIVDIQRVVRFAGTANSPVRIRSLPGIRADNSV